ncbi:hypothetical protein C3F09_05490 [candidate division GN15 bacterium]|uniref:Peptidase S11 D-alanyl-D-alanine carboxypeptidase A N-terminal domain-containing protein n=1 Tax=candidate division GN15 bacterium TaxID=2072418 RepID=A0A855X713_9BACT|nr:MAG: hypothetical protein C3F09_05490 [candidate division GN15 bacterium]
MKLRTIGVCAMVGVAVLFLAHLAPLEAGAAKGSQPSAHASLTKSRPLDYQGVRPKPPRVNLHSAIVVNYDNGKVLYAKNADLVHPIASISKLVAAMVILDKGIDLNARTTISKEDAYQSSASHLRPGWEMTLSDLMYTALMISDNRATRALARAVSGNYEDFVKEMNLKAEQLGLQNTVFYDPTGLDSRNVSTAHELAIILNQAYKYDLIAHITSLKEYSVTFKQKKRLRTLRMSNTNRMLASPYRVLAGKTGYIEASSYCLVTLLQNAAGERVTLVVLGASGGRARFREARKLADWAFKQIG